VRTRTHTHTVRSGDVALSVASAGDPSRPAVVLIHGYPDTKAVWEPVVERLAPEFHVVAYDVRGAGASDAPRRRAAYDLECLADDFEAVCGELSPGRAVNLVGHDWGGIQGWEFATAARFDGRIASFTTIAGPALGHALSATRTAVRRGQPLGALDRIRRSWSIAPLCLPGGPTLAWRVLLAGGRWRRFLAVAEGLPVDAAYPAPTIRADGLHGANLYRQNIPGRLIRRNRLAPPHAPVQLVVPSGDRFISESYYDAAGQICTGLRRRHVPGSHWAPRAEPALIADCIAQFARENARWGKDSAPSRRNART
jgi:pimeloyl-ACP methyl ester carboxylesterase